MNKIICGDWIELLKGLPDKVFHCCVTSPPYWGQRDYGCEGQLGLENTSEEHIEKLVEGFREVKRVLRDDGVLWVNYGDKYGTRSGTSANHTSRNDLQKERSKVFGMDGNLLMLPARVALALQADGWILRDDVIWAKAISFCDKYSGSTMPEPVDGWRWERHRIKIGTKKANFRSNKYVNQQAEGSDNSAHKGTNGTTVSQYKDCPGCPKCEKNGGLILRKGSWRCTKAHEHLYQFTKTNNYFCDMGAVREAHTSDPNKIRPAKGVKNVCDEKTGKMIRFKPEKIEFNPSGRNLRNVWAINPRGYKEAHYATYPEQLIEPIIKVSTSAKGVCPKCGSQWARIVDKQAVKRHRPNDRTARHNQGGGVNSCGNTVAGVNTTTIGFKATCECGIDDTVPALVLDPFMGSGTSAVVAAKLRRNYFGCEINPEYKLKHIDVRVKEVETGVPAKEVGQKGLFELTTNGHE